MNKTFDNAERHRYYGLRVGDIVNLRNIDSTVVYKNVEVIAYGAGDNNRIEVRLVNGSTTDWVAEWCDIVTKVEDRNINIEDINTKTKESIEDDEIIEKVAKELTSGIDGTDNIETLYNFGSLGLRSAKELVTAFYNGIKKELIK
jgi:hypothetical protein